MFIVLEGVDLSGKTTLAKQLHDHTILSKVLREPGSSPLATDVRVTMKKYRMDVSARQLLMHGSRMDMLANHDVMNPHRLYILDRYILSTLVYGTVDGIPTETLQRMIDLFPVPTPVVTLILHPRWTTILARSMGRSGLDALEGSMERLNQISGQYVTCAGMQAGEYEFIVDDTKYSYLDQALQVMSEFPALTPFLL